MAVGRKERLQMQIVNKGHAIGQVTAEDNAGLHRTHIRVLLTSGQGSWGIYQSIPNSQEWRTSSKDREAPEAQEVQAGLHLEDLKLTCQ